MWGLQFELRQSRALAIALVVGLHALTFWAIAFRPFTISDFKPNPELRLTLFESRPSVARSEPPRIHPDFTAPGAVIVPEPDIVIDNSDLAAVVAKPLLQKIPPRPDVTKPHDLPSLPGQFRAWSRTASLMLRIQILQDGSIGIADVMRSSGQHDIDDLVCSFVRANWHYQPATVSGVPVEDWMTVIVRFAA